jgi:HD-GYP domain-containing protein (c-di-GMP phosphodiesterase class II)
VTVADVFDAPHHDRPYQHAWPVERAVAEIIAREAARSTPTWSTPSLGC